MASQALYRKWRSRTFEEVVGQEHITRTLRNALRDKLIAHAYLFAGPRGTGKTTTARLLAKAVNCTAPEEERPCNGCHICRAIDEGRLMDLVEIDAASNRGIDEIRDLREKVGFRPTEARYKVYVVDEVHMLTNEAFNALLKTLEEPPPHVIFVLATTEPHKIPATVLSRCQRFDFRRIPLPQILRRLEYVAGQEGLSVEREALEFIARQATGSLRDALSLLDQLVAYSGREVTLEQVQAMLGVVSSQAVSQLIDFMLKGDLAGGLEFIQKVVAEGADPRQFAREVVEYLRGLMLIRAVGDASLLHLTEEEKETMSAQAARYSVGQLLRQIRLFAQASQDMRLGGQSHLPLELTFVEAVMGEETAASPALKLLEAAPAKEQMKVLPATQRPKEEARRSAPAASAPGELTLDNVRLNWARILQEVGRNSAKAQALLRSCSPLRVEEDVVTLGFEYHFHWKETNQPQSKEIVRQAISQVIGSECRVECVLVEKEAGREVSAPSHPPSQAAMEADKYRELTEDPLIQTIVKRYGAQVADVQPPGDS